MELRIIRDLSSFESLNSEYSMTTRHHRDATPFSTFGWLYSWWRAFQNIHPMEILCFYKRDKLSLVIPLMFSDIMQLNVTIKKISLLGGGWGVFCIPFGDDVSGWGDQFISWLDAKRTHDWDVLELGPLLNSSLQLSELYTALSNTNRPYKVEEIQIPYLPMNESWQDFLNSKSKNFRRTIKRKENFIFDTNSFKISHVKNPKPEIIKNTVFEVSKKSWQGGEGFSVSSAKEGQDFYLYLTGQDDISMDLAFITFENKCIAYLLGFIQDRVYHAFDTGYDPEYAEYSPGLVLHYQVLKNISMHNCNEFNFGFDHGYKNRFEPAFHQAIEINIYRNHILSNTAKLKSFIKKHLQI